MSEEGLVNVKLSKALVRHTLAGALLVILASAFKWLVLALFEPGWVREIVLLCDHLVVVLTMVFTMVEYLIELYNNRVRIHRTGIRGCLAGISF